MKVPVAVAQLNRTEAVATVPEDLMGATDETDQFPSRSYEQ